MSDVEKLTVKIQGDIKNYVSSLKTAEKETDAFASKISKVQSDAGKGVELKARADTSELDRAGGVVTALRADMSKGGTFKVDIDSSGFATIRAETNNLRSEVGNGATFRVRGDTSGLSGVASEITSARSNADNGATFRVTGDTSGMAGVATEIEAIRADTANDATLKVNADTSGLDSAGSSIDGLVSKVTGLSTALALVSVPGLIAGIGAIPSLALSAGAAVTGLASALGTGLVGAAAAAGGALGGLGAGFGLIATPVAMVIGKLTEYDKNLQAASSSQGSAVSSAYALENAEAGLESAYSASEAASSQLTDAIEQHARAQEDLNAAIEDEPTRQAENWLDVKEAQTSAAEATRQQTKAQTALNEAVASGDPEKIADAQLDLDRANNRVERSTLNVDKATDEYYDQATKGSTELQSAKDKEAQAAKGVESANRGVENAARGVESAERALAQAADQMAASQSSAAGKTVELTAAQQALYDKFKETQGIFNTAFGPAMDSVSLLGVEVLKLADEFLPELGVASDAAVGGLARGFDTFRSELLQPIPRTAIQDILEAVPGMVETASVGAGELGIAFVTAFSRTLPYGQQLLDYLGGAINKVYEFTQSAEGISTIDSALATAVETGQRLWGVATNLALGFGSLISAVNESGISEQMLGGLETFAQGFRDVTTAGTETREGIDKFLTETKPVIDATGSLLTSLKTEFFATAAAVSSAINPDTGNSTLVDLIGSLEEAVGIIGPWLSQTFIDLGPAIAEALPPLTEFFTTFVGSSDFLSNVVRDLGWFAEIFNGLPQPVKDAAVEVAAFSAATQLMGGPSLGGVVSGVGDLAFKVALLNAVGGTSVFSTIATGLLSIAGPLAAIAAVGAIAIDITYHWPEIKDAFSQAWTDANEGGSSVGAAFMAGLSAGIDQTTIGSTLFSIADGINAAIDEVATGPSLWEIITGDATLQDAESGVPLLLKKIQDAGAATGEWLKSWVPETTLYKALTGDTGGEEGSSESVASGILTSLQGAYDSVTEWFGGLAPPITLWDVLTGSATTKEAADSGNVSAGILVSLQEAWTGATEWLASLEPLGFIDKILGGTGEGDNPITTTISGWWDSFTSWWSGLDFGSLLTDFSTGFSTGFDTVTTAASDFFTSLYNDYWLYYLGSDGVITVAVTDFFTSLYNDWWLYYLGTDGLLATGISDFFTSLYNDYWLYYLGTDGTLITGISDFFTSLYNDYWLYYLGTDGTVITGISDFFTSLYNDYWLYYFGTDGTLITGISDFLTMLYNDYFLYYLGSEGTVVTTVSEGLTALGTAASDTWSSILEGVGGFASSLYDAIYNGFWTAVSAGGEALASLLDAISSVLTAINDPLSLAGTISGAAETIRSKTAFADGGVTTFANGGLGTSSKNARVHVWNEQQGNEAYIAERGPRSKQLQYLSTAASWFGLGLSPFAKGGCTSCMKDEFARGGTVSSPSSSQNITGSGNVHISETKNTGKKIGPGKYHVGGSQTYSARQSTNISNNVAMGAAMGAKGAGGNRREQAGAAQGAIGGLGSSSSGTGRSSFSGTNRGNNTLNKTINNPGHYANISLYSNQKNQVGRFAEGGLTPRQGGENGATYNWDSDVWKIVEGIYNDIAAAAEPNTYPGHPGGESRSVDWWGPGGRGDQVVAGDEVYGLAWGKYKDALGYSIWQGLFENTSGYSYDYATENPEDAHYDHIHTTWGPTSGWGETWNAIACAFSNTARGVVTKATDAAMGLAKSAMSALDMPIVESFGQVAIDSVQAWIKSMLLKLPGCSSGGNIGTSSSTGGDNEANMVLGKDLAEGFGWTGSEWEALRELWHRESNWDHTATNPDSGAFGIPQALGHGDIGSDAGSQIEWGLNYILGRYGSPSAALDFWNENGWYRSGGLAKYHRGGLVPGTGESLGLLQGGERVLPRDMSRGFESLARSVSVWRADGGSNGGIGSDGAGSLEAKLEEIREAVERSITTPTPVNVNNVHDLRVAQVTTALAALDSDVGASILDKALAEAVAHIRAMNGSAT